jgi:VIT1/CCC1 family predicted Fe2+/Mn2+ transporter
MVPGVKGTAVQLGVLVASVVIAFLTDVATGSLWVSIAALAISACLQARSSSASSRDDRS